MTLPAEEGREPGRPDVLLPVLTGERWPARSSALGFLASVPWCCVVPAALASLGLGASVAGEWLRDASPALLALAMVFFARAHYMLWVRRHGSAAAKWVIVLFTSLAAVWWAVRLSPALAAWVVGWGARP